MNKYLFKHESWVAFFYLSFFLVGEHRFSFWEHTWADLMGGALGIFWVLGRNESGKAGGWETIDFA